MVGLYEDIGRQVMDFALTTKKRKFDTEDVKLTFSGPLFDEAGRNWKLVRLYTREWLEGIANPGEGTARGPYDVAHESPKVASIIRKKWTGWYGRGGGKRRKATPRLKPDCLYYWQGGRERGEWHQIPYIEKRLAELRSAGYVVHPGHTSIGAPEGPPSQKQMDAALVAVYPSPLAYQVSHLQQKTDAELRALRKALKK